MDITLTTPALLFSTLSLLMLAYTNRYLTLANRIRSLHDEFKRDRKPIVRDQIRSLRFRVNLIKHMQGAGVMSLFLCTLCMGLLFFGFILAGKIVFGLALAFLLVSLFISLVEVQLSVRALNLHLSDLEDGK